jgi:F0F1-type ATP synthase assembly protein I
MTSAAILLLLTIADTTWRAFVPTIGGTFLGIGLDNLLHVAPIMTIIMIIVGFAVSGLLIALQIRRIRRTS